MRGVWGGHMRWGWLGWGGGISTSTDRSHLPENQYNWPVNTIAIAFVLHLSPFPIFFSLGINSSTHSTVSHIEMHRRLTTFAPQSSPFSGKLYICSSLFSGNGSSMSICRKLPKYKSTWDKLPVYCSCRFISQFQFDLYIHINEEYGQKRNCPSWPLFWCTVIS